MEFGIPEELTALRQSFAAFLDREVRALEDEYARQFWGEAPDRQVLAPVVRRIRERSAEEGFYAAYMPEEAGGQGLSVLGTTLLVEDAARSGMRLAMAAIAPPNPAGPSPLLLKLPRHLWDTYVYPVVAGEKTMCFALTEPEAGSDAQSIRTRAERDGDDWVISGHKHYITNGESADFAIVFAVTDPEKRAAGGITAFVVPADQFRRGKLQWNVSDSHPAELFFDGARVTADHVIGEVGMGFFEAMAFLNSGRAYIGAQSLGLAEWALDAAVEHVKTRTAFGKPLGKNQGVSFPLARSKADIEAIRWLVYHLAWRVDTEGDPLAIMGDASITKFYATERAYEVADRAVQAFGGMGIMREGPVERVLRHLRMLRVVEGASEVQLLVIARTLGL
ncbi:MAG: acyl-CoA dehydrogenase family protein [Candidatus Nanopelagicales bacterium]